MTSRGAGSLRSLGKTYGYVICYLGLTIAVLFPGVIAGRGLFLWDITETIIPIKNYIFGLLKTGVFPLWSPELMGGYPIYAGAEGAEFYPLNFLFLTPLPTWRALSYTLLLHVLLAGVFMYLYLSTIYTSKAAALFGAQCFMTSGFFLSRMVQLPIIESAIWLPLMFYFIERAFRRNSLGHLVRFGIVVAIQFLAFSFQISVISLSAGGSYLIYLLVARRKEGFVRDPGRILSMLLVLVVVTSLGLGVSTYKLLGLYRLLPLTLRSSALKYELASINSIPFTQFLTLIYPDFFGEISNDTAWSELHYHEGCIYMGLLPLFLALIVLLFGKGSRIWFFSLLLLGSLLIALGQYSLTFDVLYAIPIINRLRGPGRFILSAGFALSVLAAGGFQLLTSEQLSRKHRLQIYRVVTGFGVLCCLAVVGAVVYYVPEVFTGKEVGSREDLPEIYRTYLAAKQARILASFPKGLLFQGALLATVILLLILRVKDRLTPGRFISLSLVLIMLDKFWFAVTLNPTAPKSYFQNIPKTASAILADAGRNSLEPRIISKPGSKVYLYPGWSYYSEALYSGQEWLLYNIPMNWGITTFTGLMELSLSRWREGMLTIPIVRLGAPYRVVTQEIRSSDRITLVHGTPTAFRYPFSLPRAQYVSHCKIVTDSQQIIPTLKEFAYTGNQSIVLEERPAEVVVIIPDNSTKAITVPATIKDASGEHVIVTVEAPASGYVILRDIYYPDWTATVNDKPATIYQADYFFRAVEVHAGLNVIHFRYRPYGFQWGVFISEFCLVTLILALAGTGFVSSPSRGMGNLTAAESIGIDRRRFWVRGSLMLGIFLFLMINSGIQYIRDAPRFKHHFERLANSECLGYLFDEEQAEFYHEFTRKLQGVDKR